jgi:hypothetical protein
MGSQLVIPEGYHESFRRLIPYIDVSLHKDPQVIESLLIYLKLGGEKMARIAIDAFNMNQRMLEAEMRKQIRDQLLLREDPEGTAEAGGDENDGEGQDTETDEDSTE